MRSILIGIIVFVAASAIVAMNLKKGTVSSSALFVPFAKETPVVAERALEDRPVSVLSELPIQLIGTIVRVEGSLATIKVESRERENVELRSPIADLATVTRIEREHLFFMNRALGREEYVRIMPYDPAMAVSQKAMAAPGDKKEFNIRRTDVDRQLGNLPQLLTTARAEPVVDGAGHIVGFRIAAMDDSSFFKSLGLETGDVLSEVNGTKLESVEGVVKLFNELRDSSMIQLKVSRQSRDLQLTYLIR